MSEHDQEKQANIIAKDKPDLYKNPNTLIMGIQKQTKNAMKLKVLLLSDIRNAYYDEDEHVYKQKVSASEIAEAFQLKAKGGSFYNSVRMAAQNLMGSVSGVEDEERKYFKYITMIDSAEYKDGELEVCYNPAIFSTYYKDIQKDYTLLSAKIMLGFRSVYSFRLYEILKSRAFYGKNEKRTGNDVFELTFPVAKLQLQLGAVDPEDKKVRSILSGAKNPDFEKAVEAAPDAKTKAWREFNRSILKPAINEINETTNMSVEIGYVKGSHGKVQEVKFYVQYKDEFELKEDKAPLTQEVKDEIVDFVCDVTGLRSSDSRKICESAKYDKEKIRVALDVMEHNGKEVRDPVAYLINAIKEGHTVPDRSKKASASSRNYGMHRSKEETDKAIQMMEQLSLFDMKQKFDERYTEAV